MNEQNHGEKRKFEQTDETELITIADFIPFQRFGVSIDEIASEKGGFLMEKKDKYNTMVYIHNCVHQFYAIFKQWFCGPKTEIVLKDNGHRCVIYPFHYKDHYADIASMINYWGINMKLYTVNETIMFLTIYSQLQIFWKSAVHKKNVTDDVKLICIDQLKRNIEQLDRTIKCYQTKEKLKPIRNSWWKSIVKHFDEMANLQCVFDIEKILICP